MATASATNDFARAAQALDAIANRTFAEQLFHDALEDARAEASSKHDNELLAYLPSIHDPTSLMTAIERVFNPKMNDKMSRKLARVFEKLERPFEVIRRVSECNQTIAKPVVGVICYSMTVIQELLAIDELVVSFQEQAERNFQAFNTYFLRGDELNQPLKDSIKSFYKVTLYVSLSATSLYQGSAARQYPRLLLGNPKSKLEGLIQRLEKTADWVFKMATGDTHQRVIALQNAQAEPQVCNQALGAEHQPDSGSVSVQLSATPHFSGRGAILDAMADALGDFGLNGPRELSLWGTPGVGKSQLSLQYLRQQSADGNPQRKYSQTIFLRANDPATIRNEFRRAAMGLRLVKPSLIQDQNDHLVIEAIMTWFERTDKWLLVLDNVKDLNDLIKYRPSRGKGHIIYTTRSKITAELLCPPPHALEVLLLSNQAGATLVRALMGTAFSTTPDAEEAAQKVSAFAGGLPLAIEQVTHLSKFERISLHQTLRLVSEKKAFLEQQAANSFHEENLSTGAILVTAFEAIARRYPMAAALFQLLSYAEPSSIPISMLLKGASEMESYLARRQTHDRGVIRTREGHEEYTRKTTPKRFDLLDYDPFERHVWRRALRMGEHKKVNRPTILPRVDSRSDVELQGYWQNNANFRGVFQDKHQMGKSLNQLEDSGLLKRVGQDTLWIHDLYAELMTVHTASMEPKEQSEPKVHLAAVMVWLAIPVPRRSVQYQCFELLPHAQSCLKHLKEHGTLLTDATVGAELSHVVASTFCLRNGWANDIMVTGSDPVQRMEDLRTGAAYYKDAFRGYMAAKKRLMKHPDMKEATAANKVVKAVVYEMAVEEECQLLGASWRWYDPDRWAVEFERFGGNAVWRCIQTCGKLGRILWDMGELEEAEWWLRQTKRGVDLIWGVEVGEVDIARDTLLRLLMEKKDWEGALVVAEERKVRYELLCGYRGAAGLGDPLSFTRATGTATMLGRCLINLKRWEEGKRWLRVALAECRIVEGRYGSSTWRTLKDLAWAAALTGQWRESLEWWLEIVGLVLNLKDEDELVEEAAVGFYEARAKYEETGELDEELQNRVEMAEGVIRMVKVNVRTINECQRLRRFAHEDDHDDPEEVEIHRMTLEWIAQGRGEW